jgi:hypothetical protein
MNALPPALPRRARPSPLRPGPASARWVPAGTAGVSRRMVPRSESMRPASRACLEDKQHERPPPRSPTACATSSCPPGPTAARRIPAGAAGTGCILGYSAPDLDAVKTATGRHREEPNRLRRQRAQSSWRSAAVYRTGWPGCSRPCGSGRESPGACKFSRVPRRSCGSPPPPGPAAA